MRRGYIKRDSKQIKILLSLYKAKRGMTWPMISRFKDISYEHAYTLLMRFRQQGWVTRRLSDVRGKYKSYRFFIAEEGIKQLQAANLINPRSELAPPENKEER